MFVLAGPFLGAAADLDKEVPSDVVIHGPAKVVNELKMPEIAKAFSCRYFLAYY